MALLNLGRSVTHVNMTDIGYSVQLLRVIWTLPEAVAGWEMDEVGLSAVHRKLLDYGIDESVAAELDHIHQSGTVTALCFAYGTLCWYWMTINLF